VFDFFKNKGVKFVTDELNECMSYVSQHGSKSGTDVDQILNTIRHFIEEILDGKMNEQQAQQHFMKMKTNIATVKNLSNYQDLDYSKAYILNAFFTCVASNKLSESKLVGRKILNYCADNSSLEVRVHAKELRDGYMNLFK